MYERPTQGGMRDVRKGMRDVRKKVNKVPRGLSFLLSYRPPHRLTRADHDLHII